MDHLDEQGLGDYLAVLRRRKWIVLLAIVVAPIVAFELAASKPKLYTASAHVLLTSSLTGVSNPLTGSAGATGVPQTEIEIAGSPAIAKRVVTVTGITDRSAGQVLSEASFSGIGDADVLQISITDRDPAVAVTLANAYADQYMTYRRQLGTSFIASTRKQIEARMKVLRVAGQGKSAVYTALAQNDQNLLEAAALQTASAVMLTPASGAGQVQPKPLRDGIIGFGVGLLLGFALALLWDVIDTRIRSAHEVSVMLGEQLLGRLSTPPRKLRRRQGLVMLDAPESPDAEAFRHLRASVDFANADTHAKVIMITSALPGEGKSTTAANLAVALAKAGKDVVLVDLDLRDPTLHKLFKLQGDRWAQGLTSVALGKVELEFAMAYLPVGTSSPGWRTSSTENGGAMLQVLPCGPLPSDPGEFVGSGAVHKLLERLCERAEIVLLDTPPLLGVGDAASLSSVADGIIVVTRLGMLRRPLLGEARRILDASPAAKLGFVVTGAEHEEGYGHQRYDYYYHPPSAAVRLESREDRLQV